MGTLNAYRNIRKLHNYVLNGTVLADRGGVASFDVRPWKMRAAVKLLSNNMLTVPITVFHCGIQQVILKLLDSF